jgi:hypothetical protein
MFDLEQSISDWRLQMLAAGIKTPVPLEELESHLREEIERQIKSGLSLNEQEAFNFAVRKIGQAEKLKMEFQKAGMISSWRFLAALGGLAIAVIGCVGVWQALFAYQDIKGWLLHGGVVGVGGDHPAKVDGRLWAAFMCLFPPFLISTGSVILYLSIWKKARRA